MNFLKKIKTSRERIFLIAVLLITGVSLVLAFMGISGFFSDNVLNDANISTGNLSVEVNNLKVYNKTSDTTKFVIPDPNNNHETDIIVRPDKIGKFSFTVDNTGSSGISADVYLNINFGANFNEKGVILIYPMSVSDSDITTALASGNDSQAIVKLNADDQVSIESSTGTFNGIRQKIDTVKLDSSAVDGTTGIATTPGEISHYYEYKIVFLDDEDLPPEYYYNSLELKIEAAAVFHDLSVPNWTDEDSDYFRCHIADPIRYSNDGLLLFYDGVNNTGLGHSSSTNTWRDLVGTNDGNLMGNPTWGRNGLNFDGVDDKVKFVGDITQRYTILATFDADLTFSGSYPRIYAEEPFPSLYIRAGALYLYGHGQDALFPNSKNEGLIHSAMVFNGSNVTLYINGVLAGSVATTSLPASVVDAFLGGRANNNRQFKGSIHDFLIYDHALTPAEVDDAYKIQMSKIYVPVETALNFENIGSGKVEKVNGVVYTFDSTAMYEVKNNISFTNPNPGMWMPNITGTGSITSYDKVVTITNTDSSVHYYQNQLYVTKDNAVKDGLVLHYDSINNAGTGTHVPAATMWNDLKGTNHATLTGVATWTGALGGLAFDGASGRATFSSSAWNFVSDYTMIMTIKPELIGAYPRLFGERPFPSLYLNSSPGINYRFGFLGEGVDTSFAPSIFPSTTTPTYVVITYSGSANSVNLFVNGKKIGTLATSGPPDLGSFPDTGFAYLGARPPSYDGGTGTRFYKGLIYDYMVYNRMLSDFEIEKSYITNYSKYY
jgi:hypothetical protein